MNVVNVQLRSHGAWGSSPVFPREEESLPSSSAKSSSKHVPVDWVAVGRRIREMRGFDMTQEEFAERSGISQNYLSTMERGKVEIGAEILLRISRKFLKSVDWLLTGEG